MRNLQDSNRQSCAAWTDANLLREAVPSSSGLPLAMWSGWMGDGPWERDPRAWLPSAYEELKARLTAARERIEHEQTRWLLRPHARHVLNDPQRCARFLADVGGGGDGIGLLLDPVSMLEPEMLAHSEDHIPRIMERLGPMVEWVILPAYGVSTTGAGDGEERVTFASAPSDCVLSAERVWELASAWLEGRRVVLEG